MFWNGARRRVMGEKGRGEREKKKKEEGKKKDETRAIFFATRYEEAGLLRLRI